jgi:hypothetical protein
MAEDKDESSQFRVVDRRPFSSDGTPRESPAEQKEPPRASSAPSPGPQPAEEELEYEGAEELGPPGFDTIISYLSTTAMFQLGLLAGPGGQRIPPDLVNARRTIDMLEVLQEKTEGNLTANESRMLEEVLYELRLSYVGVQERFTQKPR